MLFLSGIFSQNVKVKSWELNVNIHEKIVKKTQSLKKNQCIWSLESIFAQFFRKISLKNDFKTDCCKKMWKIDVQKLWRFWKLQK